ncbi:hypothetical protein F5X98DRAFT_386670 [Xylaria grammica]|nr:hypothetical protein F5X98DRAFT_386670 [Xylaria grammica]
MSNGLVESARSGDCVMAAADSPLYSTASNELPRSYKEPVDRFVDSRSLVTNGALEDRPAYPISRVYRSMCVGTLRLTFGVEYKAKGPIVSFRQHIGVIGNPKGPKGTRMYCFVRSTIILRYPFSCPVKIPVNVNDRIINSILKPPNDHQKLDVLYRIYCVIVGLATDPSVIVFYDQTGHEGKTTLAKNLTRLHDSERRYEHERDPAGGPADNPADHPVQALLASEQKGLKAERGPIYVRDNHRPPYPAAALIHQPVQTQPVVNQYQNIRGSIGVMETDNKDSHAGKFIPQNTNPNVSTTQPISIDKPVRAPDLVDDDAAEEQRRR